MVRWNREGEDDAEKNRTDASEKRKSRILKFIPVSVPFPWSAF